MNKKLRYAVLLPLMLCTVSVWGQMCNGVWGTPLLDLTFGQGTTSQAWYTPLSTYAPGLSTNTVFVNSVGLSAANVSGLVKNTATFGSSPNWVQGTDHTGDPNGLLLGINMPDNIGDTVVQYVMTNLCPNTTLEFSIWLLNLMAKTNGSANSPSVQRPNMLMRIIDPATNTVLASQTTGNVPIDEVWHQYAIVFSNGSSATVLLQLINNTQGSNVGNDVALDDIVVRPCVPALTLLPQTPDTVVCDSTSILLAAQITPGIYTPSVYEWEYHTGASTVWQTGRPYSLDSTWLFAPGSGTYTVRYWVTAQGLSGNAGCSQVSREMRITFGKTPRVALGPDLVLCSDSTQLLAPAPAGTSWLWNTNGEDSTLEVVTSGNYWVRLTDSSGCSSSDTINVKLNATIGVNLGNDTSICDANVPYTLQSSQPAGVHYLWSTGLTDSAIQVSYSGQYWLEVDRANCTGRDTIDIKVVATPKIDIGNDTVICEQTPITIGALVPGATYLWSTGAASPSIDVSKTGAYILSLTYDGCVARDTIQVTAMPSPDINLGPNRDICPQQTIPLDATDPNSTIYKWGTGDTKPVYNATEPGTYSVTVVSEYGCTSSDSVTLKYFAKPTIILGNDTVVCDETPLTIMPLYAINEDSMRWSTGSTNRQINITEGGTFIVTSMNKCGDASDTINVRQIFCDILLPNAFTPNGDGINDVFKILGNIGRIQDVSFSVYNRWGQMLFYTHDKYKGWDGRQNGGDVMVGVYVYLLQYSIDGKPYTEKGNLTLIR